MKNGSRLGLGYVTYFLKFWDPLISIERLKVQTLSFARRLTVRGTKPKNEKLLKSGRGRGHVTYFSNFGTPPPNIYGADKDTNLKFCMRTDRKRY